MSAKPPPRPTPDPEPGTTPAPRPKPKKGDLLELAVSDLDEKGRGAGVVGDVSVRVRGAAPGSRIRARVHRRRRGVVEAGLDAVLEAGPLAVTPRCDHFGVCGGCSFQNLEYSAQLAELGRLLFRVIAPLEPARVDPVEGCDEPFGYRNKMEFTFGARRWIDTSEPEDAPDGFALGLHVPGRHEKVLDVHRCDIAFPEASAILGSARESALARGLDAWDVRAHTGLLRHLVLRKGLATGEILAYLVTSRPDPAVVDAFAEELGRRHPEITTFVHGTSTRPAQVAASFDGERVLFGSGRIREELAGLSFSISPASFFQTNTAQAERLVAIVLEEVGAEPGAVFDLYCGCGTFTLPLARAGAHVVGFELVEAAVSDGRANAAENGLEVSFVTGDLSKTLAEHLDRLDGTWTDGVGVCVVDPPRAGMHPRVIGTLRRLAPPRIVYVSCNPKAAIRDLLPFVRDGYEVVRARPIDLFPHTPHLECVLTLERGTAPTPLAPPRHSG